MTRIFISHSHSDEAIAQKLFDFLIAAFPEFREEDILCTSDPNSGLSFDSNTISDQLKRNLKGAGALVGLITTDSLRSPWIPFEIGAFWPTEKTIVLILGPGLTPETLSGPLKGWHSICIENDRAFEQLNQVINQLEEKLDIRQNVKRSRRDRCLRDFITQFRAWESRLAASEVSQLEQAHFIEDLGNGLTLDMLAIPGGNFLMGTEDEEIERLVREYGDEWFTHEKPQHEVTVQPFFMGKYTITQAQYQQVMGRNPSNFKGYGRPVENVSWNEAVEFCKRLSKLTGKKYRLPTEAEWEYACRAGTTEPYHFGETIIDRLVNYRDRVRETTFVGQFLPNAFGLYDMHGNVWEWCQDDWHNNYEVAPKDGSAWLSDNKDGAKVLRGGSWLNEPRYCRSAYRIRYDPDNSNDRYGFRVACGGART